MAVRIQFITVVVPRRRIREVPGLEALLAREHPNAWGDEHLWATASMSPVHELLAFFEAQGLTLREPGAAVRTWRDVCVVDYYDGPTNPCPWLVHDGAHHVAWLAGTEPGVVRGPAHPHEAAPVRFDPVSPAAPAVGGGPLRLVSSTVPAPQGVAPLNPRLAWVGEPVREIGTPIMATSSVDLDGYAIDPLEPAAGATHHWLVTARSATLVGLLVGAIPALGVGVALGGLGWLLAPLLLGAAVAVCVHLFRPSRDGTTIVVGTEGVLVGRASARALSRGLVRWDDESDAWFESRTNHVSGNQTQSVSVTWSVRDRATLEESASITSSWAPSFAQSPDLRRVAPIARILLERAVCLWAIEDAGIPIRVARACARLTAGERVELPLLDRRVLRLSLPDPSQPRVLVELVRGGVVEVTVDGPIRAERGAYELVGAGRAALVSRGEVGDAFVLDALCADPSKSPLRGLAQAREREAIVARAMARARREPTGEPRGQLAEVWGPMPGRPTWLYDEVLLGRSEAADVFLDHDGCAPEHALVTWSEGRFVIRDLGAQHGTFVNNERVTTTRALAEGDRIRVGGYVFRFETRISMYDGHIVAMNAQAFARAMAQAQQRDRRIGVMLFRIEDMDRSFREHPAAMAVITHVTTILRANVPHPDAVQRTGNEEQGVVWTGLDLPALQARAEQLRALLEVPVAGAGAGATPRVSVGCAAWEPTDCRAWELVRAAEKERNKDAGARVAR